MSSVVRSISWVSTDRSKSDRHGHFGEDREAGRIDLGKSAIDDDRKRAALAVQHQNARPQRRHQRGVAGEHAEVAFGARDVDLIDLAGEQ